MSAGDWVTAVLLAVLFMPLGVVPILYRRARMRESRDRLHTPMHAREARRRAEASQHPAVYSATPPTPTSGALPPTPPTFNPESPAGFATLTTGAYLVDARNEGVFTDSHGIVLHIVTPHDRAPFLICHDREAEAGRCWHRSPDLPAAGGWTDWLLNLAELRSCGLALNEITIADLRALAAFMEYGTTRRAQENGAFQ